MIYKSTLRPLWLCFHQLIHKNNNTVTTLQLNTEGDTRAALASLHPSQQSQLTGPSAVWPSPNVADLRGCHIYFGWCQVGSVLFTKTEFFV